MHRVCLIRGERLSALYEMKVKKEMKLNWS